MIISLMDNDRVGKLEAIWLHKHYNTPMLFLSIVVVKIMLNIIIMI